MKSMKRKPEDFQFTYKNGSCELGKGSFGEVKLVTENSTGILYAMKIVRIISILSFNSFQRKLL